MGRPIPKPDALSTPFWDAARKGELKVQQCCDCSRYWFPPVEYCTRCLSPRLEFRAVSGKGKLYSYSEAHTGARLSHFAAAGNYLVCLVELDEQPGLLMYTNLPGARADQLKVGLPVTVTFEKISDDVTLPQFVVDVTAEKGAL
jgi:uncharacterized OB-fold protein